MSFQRGNKASSGPPRTWNAYGRGISKPKRDLAMACQEAATDEELAEWLIEIFHGRWPKRLKQSGGQAIADMVAVPPSERARMKAIQMFLERRDGRPAQHVHIKAELEARAKFVDNAADVIDVEAIDVSAARALEAALASAVGLADVGNETEERVLVEDEP